MNDLVVTAPATAEAFRQMVAPHAPLPWSFGTDEHAGNVFDANGELVAAVDIDGALDDADAITVAALIVAAVNTCAAHPPYAPDTNGPATAKRGDADG